MGYLTLANLGQQIQEKLNKLQSGKLSLQELEELKTLSTELNERIIILNYKAEEINLLKDAGKIIETKQETVSEVQTPIKINISKVEQPFEELKSPLVSKQSEPELNLFAETVDSKSLNEIPKTETKQPESLLINSGNTGNVITPKASLVDRMQKTKLSDLKTAIGLNQKFLFMNFLFEGENNSYNDAIDKLNVMPTAADARHYVRELAYIYNWNFEDENVVLFTEYVERRYL